MNSALLRMEEIEFYAPTYKETQFGVYEDPDGWEFKHSARAGLINQSMSRNVENGEVVFDKSRTFLVRTYVEVEDNWRIKWKGKYWQIESISDNKYYLDKEIITTKVEE